MPDNLAIHSTLESEIPVPMRIIFVIGVALSVLPPISSSTEGGLVTNTITLHRHLHIQSHSKAPLETQYRRKEPSYKII